MLGDRVLSLLFFLLIRHPPRPPLFPYTTLFRSHEGVRRLEPLVELLEEDVEAAFGRGPPAERRDQTGRAVRHHPRVLRDRKSTRLNSSHANISYAVFCLQKKEQQAPNLARGGLR